MFIYFYFILIPTNTYQQISLQTRSKNIDIFLINHMKTSLKKTNSALHWMIIIPQSPKFMVFPKSINQEFLYEQLFLGLDLPPPHNITKSLAKMLSPLLAWLTIHTHTHTHIYIYIYIYIYITGSLAEWVECSPMVQETWVQSQVRHTKDFENGTCLTLSIIMYVSRVK